MRDVDTSTEELAADYGSVQDYQQLNHSKADPNKKLSEAIMSKKQTFSQKGKQACPLLNQTQRMLKMRKRMKNCGRGLCLTKF